MQAAQERAAAQPKATIESLQIRLKRFEDAVLKREQAAIARAKAAVIAENAQIALGKALDAESSACDEVFVAREALKPETHPERKP